MAVTEDSTFLRYSKRLLRLWYQLALVLGLLNCRFNRRTAQFHQTAKKNKILSKIWRTLLILTYSSLVPTIFKKLKNTPSSYVLLIANLQLCSVSIFSVYCFISQMQNEKKIMETLNQFFRLYFQIVKRSQCDHIFGGKFVLLLSLKLLTTLCGFLHEIPELIRAPHSSIYFHIFSAAVGTYLWLGSMFVLDACFLAFLVIAAMYQHMAEFIITTLGKMRYIEGDEDLSGKKLSHYRRMNLLCHYADVMDAVGRIYDKLYTMTKRFSSIFQWQIFYYIYYNFTVILLLLHECIWNYIDGNYIDSISIFMVSVKIGNLTLLVMCAHYAVRESQTPSLLCLDIVCTDIDSRWDMSVQAFLSQRKAENLEIEILGIFQLNNEFILVLLSAIISYLFILIQFGLTGGFDENIYLKNKSLHD